MHGKTKKTHRIRRAILWILLLAVLVIGVMIGYRVLQDKYTEVYQGYTVENGSLNKEYSYDSSVTVKDSVIYMAPDAGKVRRVYVSEGDEVSKGDALMMLNDGTRFTADFDGKVNQIWFSEGESYERDAQLMQIADFRHLRVSFRVDEFDIGVIHPGQPCTVTVDALNEVYPAVIDGIDYGGTNIRSMTYYMARIDLDVSERVHPGMQVTVSVMEQLADGAVLLNKKALAFNGRNQAYVYLQDEDGAMTIQEVALGESDDNRVEITDGLKPGQTVYAKVDRTQTARGFFGRMMQMSPAGSGSYTRRNGTGTNWQNRQNQQNRMPSGGWNGN